MSVPLQFRLHSCEQRHILLHRQPAHKAQHLIAVVGASIALRRMEEFGIHAARHQVTWPPGQVFQLPAKLGVGRKQHLRLFVESRN